MPGEAVQKELQFLQFAEHMSSSVTTKIGLCINNRMEFKFDSVKIC